MNGAGRQGHLPGSAGNFGRRCGWATCRSAAGPFCCTPNRDSATPSSSSAMRRCCPAAVPTSSSLFESSAVQCVSLKSELRSADRDVLRDLPNLAHLGDELGDFTDTAAIISLLDVVVSVDPAVAHLAGALGKPVVILLAHAADFR